MAPVAVKHPIVAAVAVLCLAFLGCAAALVSTPGTADAGTVAVTITPPSSKGTFQSGATVSISVGPNTLFVPHRRVVILECSDPGGSSSQLPTSLSNCDENTVQADTVLVQSDGSLSDKGYTLYSLPNATLGEQGNWQPACNATHPCVLFVGQDQNDFTQPKTFSQPFSIVPSSSPTVTPTVAPTASVTPSSTVTTAVSAAVTLPAATLAYTGAQGSSVWVLLMLGSMLVGMGWLSRLLLRRTRR